MTLRPFKLVVRGLIALLVFVIGLGAFVSYRALPDYAGAAPLPGLSAETRVWRDNYGVPHIFAASMDDAMRALGYVHASERLLQMEIQRRAGQGRLAETFGADLLGADRFLRTLGLYRLAQSSLAALSPEANARLQAYADGVNAFLDSHKSSPSPALMIVGVKPERWQPADSLVWGKLMSLQLSNNYRLEALRAKLQQKLASEQARWLFPMPPAGSPVTTSPVVGTQHAAAPSAIDQIGALTSLDHGASNEWVIAGERTTTGKPILANDPHLGLEAPILWYLARIVTPQGSLKGATVPGVPLVLLGQNDSIAWGMTNAGADVQDLFVETVDPAAPDRYLTPDGSQPFTTRDETIHVKDAADVSMTIRSTRHGPVLSDVDVDLAALAGAGKAMALAFEGLGDRDTTMEALMRLSAAHDWSTFRDALKLFQTPAQNVVYADASGDIGFISAGLIPVRKSGDGLTPANGADGAADWIGTVPFDDLPQLRNPPAGFAFNANNANVVGDRSLAFGQDWEEPFRAQRLQQFFDTIDKHSLDTSAAMQGDHISLAARALLPFLKTLTPANERARQALTLLANWDGDMDRDRAEPLIFDAFLLSLHRLMIDEKAGFPVVERGPFDASTLRSLLTDHPAWCDAPGAPDADCRRTLARALDDGLALLTKRDGPDMSAWTWGREHVSVIQHKIFSHVPLLDRLSDLSLPSSGDFYTLDRGNGFTTPPDQPFARTHAAGYRGLYDLANPDRSRFVIATGESGHLFSRHYGDQLPLWRDVKAITLAGGEDDLRRAGAQEFVFTPQ